MKLQRNEKQVEGVITTMVEEELFIGSVFLGDVSNLDLSKHNHREELFGRMGFVSVDNKE